MDAKNLPSAPTCSCGSIVRIKSRLGKNCYIEALLCVGWNLNTTSKRFTHVKQKIEKTQDNVICDPCLNLPWLDSLYHLQVLKCDLHSLCDSYESRFTVVSLWVSLWALHYFILSIASGGLEAVLFTHFPLGCPTGTR
jgi:hypothetical protein